MCNILHDIWLAIVTVITLLSILWSAINIVMHVDNQKRALGNRAPELCTQTSSPREWNKTAFIRGQCNKQHMETDMNTRFVIWIEKRPDYRFYNGIMSLHNNIFTSWGNVFRRSFYCIKVFEKMRNCYMYVELKNVVDCVI